jgi:Ras-related protein Rab-1A
MSQNSISQNSISQNSISQNSISQNSISQNSISHIDYLFKIVLIGDTNVGKSSILLRYTDNIYNNRYISTIGVDFKIKTISLGNKIIKLQIWDTAGQEKFKTITTSYYRGAHGFIVVYDITNFNSFISVKSWIQEIKFYSTDNKAKIIILGNKNELEDKREVNISDTNQLSNELNIPIFEVSAKNNIDITRAINSLVSELEIQFINPYLYKHSSKNDNITSSSSIIINSYKNKLSNNYSKCCG